MLFYVLMCPTCFHLLMHITYTHTHTHTLHRWDHAGRPHRSEAQADVEYEAAVAEIAALLAAGRFVCHVCIHLCYIHIHTHTHP